jgi:hypothetical protein
MTEATEVEVTQADREEAASYYYSAGGSPSIAAEIRDGKKDTWFRVQAFARHRVRALTQAGASLTAAQKAGPVLLEALKAAESAIAEYYRYWTGGETRGSYDGKPERAGLWEAQRKARASIAQTQEPE